MELHEYAESSHPLVRIAAYRDIISAKQDLTKQRLALERSELTPSRSKTS